MDGTDKIIERAVWYLYMVRCHDGTLYTGISNDVTRRCYNNVSLHRAIGYASHKIKLDGLKEKIFKAWNEKLKTAKEKRRA